jgi:hypothetical protein
VYPAPRVVVAAGDDWLRRREDVEGLPVVHHLYPLCLFLILYVNVICILATIWIQVSTFQKKKSTATILHVT